MKKQTLIFLFLTLFLAVGAVRAQDADDAPIKVNTLLLTMPLTVSDHSGRNVPGLKKADFSIFQNGVEQDIEYFFNEEAPMNVAVLIDSSASTREVLDKIQKSARSFVKLFRPEDKGIIVTFDYQTMFLSDLTADKKKLAQAIEQIRIADRAGSDMNDAVSRIVNSRFASFKGRKAIIVLTDGMVMRQNVSTQQTLEMLQKSDTLFYPIIFKNDFYAAARSKAAANKRKPLPIELLEFLARESSGKFYEKDADNLKEAFQNIAQELKDQYLLGFYPQNGAAEKAIGNIRIEVARQELTVKTRKKWNPKN